MHAICFLNLYSYSEWFSWHFPELAKLVSDHHLYARLCVFIRNRSTLNEEKLDELSELTQDTELAQRIIDASKSSMGKFSNVHIFKFLFLLGTDISEIDMTNIDHFATRLVSLVNYRKELGQYLSEKMNVVAPNLAALIGDSVGARLISHAGSLTNLAKYPASTVQILGAEKALFRALKTRGKTPKYGLIFNSTFIGRAASKNKGRISRFLANKCSIASRIDSFSDIPSTAYGEALRKQVEDRLEFFDSGISPAPNAKVMSGVLQLLASSAKTSDKSIVTSGKRSKPSEEVNEEEDTKEVKKSKKSTPKELTETPKATKSSTKDKDKSEVKERSEKKDKEKSEKKDKSAKRSKKD